MWPKTSVKQNIQNGNLISVPDFCFPFSTSFTKETLDGKHLISIGTYPSQVKCFSLNDLNLLISIFLIYLQKIIKNLSH